MATDHGPALDAEPSATPPSYEASQRESSYMCVSEVQYAQTQGNQYAYAPQPGIVYQPQHHFVIVEPALHTHGAGVAVVGGQPFIHVPDYTIFSIVSMLFCCFLGGFSLIQVTKSKRLAKEGKFQMAQMKARSARNFACLAVVMGLCMIPILYFISIFF